MKLSVLTHKLDAAHVLPGKGTAGEDPEIRGLCYRSDHACAGFVFVAMQGANTDGHDYIADAVSRGAVAVVVEKSVSADVMVIKVSDARRALAIMADTFYDSPSKRMKLIGITGTNGKTTTMCLLEHILRQNHYKTGVIGTIDCHFDDHIIAGTLTTPEAPDLQSRLARMAKAGVTHVIMEVSSHGVVQDRIFGCCFAMGIFTNLSRDHLDFHGSMDAYRAAKKAFFTTYIHGDAVAVINCDTDEGARLAAELNDVKKIIVETDSSQPNEKDSGTGTIWAENLSFDQKGISGRVLCHGDGFDFHSPLVGRFNLENIMCAVAASLELGVEPEVIRNAIATFTNVSGRLERVANNSSRYVFVDYCHTPDALENVLRNLKEIVPGRLICVFGCGGDRDRGKRPLMGTIAANIADIAIVTSDNPRTESPQAIIAEILEGVRLTGKLEVAPDLQGADCMKNGYAVEPDRSKAIEMGIRVSNPGDVVLIAGKGHETYQIIGTTINSFDDRVHAQQALAKYGME